MEPLEARRMANETVNVTYLISMRTSIWICRCQEWLLGQQSMLSPLTGSIMDQADITNAKTSTLNFNASFDDVDVTGTNNSDLAIGVFGTQLAKQQPHHL